MRIAALGTEAGAFAMMVVDYWEQACALLNYGLLHEDLFFETSGEFIGFWERVKPFIQQGRERFVNQQFLAHLEKPRTAMKPGLRPAHPVISLLCANLRNRCALSWARRLRPEVWFETYSRACVR
jgi:hypothetical protein